VPTDLDAIAARLMRAYDTATQLQPITDEHPDFDVDAAYAVLARIEATRRDQGWRPVGRKIGFTNRTIWARYGVSRPMWAHVWDRTVQHTSDGQPSDRRPSVALDRLVQPRLEPEIVFGLRAPLGPTDDRRTDRGNAALESVGWIAAGFEVVQSHFPDWRFTAADCTAAFGLHGALVVGPPLPVTDANRADLAEALPAVVVTLANGSRQVDQGVGENVLGSPALALAHLAGVLAGQPDAPPLAAGEIVTTGTITDAWPVAPGETWTSTYAGGGALAGLRGLTVTFT